MTEKPEHYSAEDGEKGCEPLNSDDVVDVTLKTSPLSCVLGNF